MVRNPPKVANVEDLGVKIIQWEEDLKTHEFFESSGTDDDDDEESDGEERKIKTIMPETMKRSNVKQMLPKDVMDVV